MTKNSKYHICEKKKRERKRLRKNGIRTLRISATILKRFRHINTTRHKVKKNSHEQKTAFHVQNVTLHRPTFDTFLKHDDPSRSWKFLDDAGRTADKLLTCQKGDDELVRFKTATNIKVEERRFFFFFGFSVPRSDLRQHRFNAFSLSRLPLSTWPRELIKLMAFFDLFFNHNNDVEEHLTIFSYKPNHRLS